MQEYLNNIYSSSSLFSWGIFVVYNCTQPGWYHFLHISHCTISSPLSGSLQIQNMGSSSSLGSFTSLFWQRSGNGDIFCDIKQSRRCGRIDFWSNTLPVGSCPVHKAVAKAIAKRPQSLLPLCHWTAQCWIVMVSPWYCRRSAMTFLMLLESVIWRLS